MCADFIFMCVAPSVLHDYIGTATIHFSHLQQRKNKKHSRACVMLSNRKYSGWYSKLTCLYNCTW